MTLNFQKTLQQALQRISFSTNGLDNQYYELTIHDKKELRTRALSDEIISRYGKAKWKIVDMLNQQYSTVLGDKFDLYNWLHNNEEDELAYFLNEIGSNCLNYSEFKTPSKFHLWLGSKGFVVGIEQKGDGFNTEEIYQQNIKQNEGAGFQFLDRCKNTVFFDDVENTRIVFMEHIFS